MNTVPREVTSDEIHKEVVHGAEGQQDETLVEMGAVSETKGGVFGAKFDGGAGYQSF